MFTIKKKVALVNQLATVSDQITTVPSVTTIGFFFGGTGHYNSRTATDFFFLSDAEPLQIGTVSAWRSQLHWASPVEGSPCAKKKVDAKHVT